MKANLPRLLRRGSESLQVQISLEDGEEGEELVMGTDGDRAHQGGDISNFLPRQHGG